jgi:LPS-assembly protein
MATPTGARPIWLRRSVWCGASCAIAMAALVIASLIDARTTSAQQRGMFTFPTRQKAAAQKGKTFLRRPGRQSQTSGGPEPMLVRADEINYDNPNERVAAVGNVQIYRNGTTLESDRVIYDQKTKRLHAEGNVRITEPDGKITYGDIIDLSDDFRDGFVDSMRLDGPDQVRMAANRADRTAGNFTVLQNGVYTACEPCKDDPKKPPKWQVKAARIIHDQGEQMVYFEDTSLEFFGIPLAWMPFFSTPDPTAKRKSGFLIPSYTTNSSYGFAVTTPYYFALSPYYDVTFSPTITTRQGPLLQAEWRQRLMTGSYYIMGSGIFQLDKEAFANQPGYQDFRGHVTTSGRFALTEKWNWGWDGWLISDKTYLQDYGLYRVRQSNNLLLSTPDYALSQAYLQGRGDRSYFDVRALYFYGFTSVDDQKLAPIVHPVLQHDYTVGNPILGGELSFHTNLTSLTRESAAFDPITQLASTNGLCAFTNPDPSNKNASNCLLRGIPGTYTRASTEVNWRRTIVDSYGQVFTPFVSLRGDVSDVQISNQAGVSNFIATGQTDVARFMPTAGLEYRYPFINVQSWGTQTIEPIAQIIARPNETSVGKLPNEDAQSMVFDASNLFRVDKFSGWDRIEGGGRLNAGLQYTAQFNRGGYLNALFGQSYHLFGQNSFAVGGTTNTGIGSGLDTDVSDYVARLTFQPTAQLTFTSRFRFSQADFTLQRSEFESSINVDRWTATLAYGNYAAQPAVGFVDRREGVLASGRFKVNPNWQVIGGVQYDVRAGQVSATNLGVGYVDDCLILALNYVTQYSYSTAATTYNRSVMLQLSLRTLGGYTVSTGLGAVDSTLNSTIPGLPK